ncbi:MAG: acylneuraminate cytidylyltransferase family protein [Muribaculaceae bacterium]|nr:acylneuraminate cytidylyltransferase family protein [Muribaculaceae bacterium]
MTPLFIIPARGGSKGIPHKNIKPLAGRPLIAYTIDAARGAGADDRHLILSTDDPQIADTARALGMQVPYMRPAPLASDTAGSREVILDVMSWADANGIDYDCVVLLQPTSPLRVAKDILGALELYTPEADMVVSVTECASNPYYNVFETTPDGFLSISKGDGLITRRQDAPKVWEYNGAVYVINPDSIRTMPLGMFPRRIPYAMPAGRSVDIDTPADWLVAEAMLGTTQSNRQTF